MNDKLKPDWDPQSKDVLRDQRAAYNEMRERCPVAYSEFMQWSLFRHEDVTRVLHDHETFSNAVSQHLSVPNGMDPPEHTAYRPIIERYFTPQRMDTFEPPCREIAAALVQNVMASGEVELMADLALPFAVRVQCAFQSTPSCRGNCAPNRPYCPPPSTRSSGVTGLWWPTGASRPARWKSAAERSMPASESRSSGSLPTGAAVSLRTRTVSDWTVTLKSRDGRCDTARYRAAASA